MTDQQNEATGQDGTDLNALIRYPMWSVFKVGSLDGIDRAAAADELTTLLDKAAEQGVITRGSYDVQGLRADADIMFWWVGDSPDRVQDVYTSFRRTRIGRLSTPVWSVVGLHRPAEFNRGHVPAFLAGEEPREYVCVYPFVRSYEWYLLDPKERRRILAEHGQAARDFPDVRANTVPAFALGDYEWMLAFEGPKLDRIVDLMHQMRYTDARLHVREETPFFSGRRVADIGEIVEILP